MTEPGSTPASASDDPHASPPAPTSIAIDTSLRLDGIRSVKMVIDAAVEHGDVIETHALEIKSDVDPTTKVGAAKVARFILGAANRLPADAESKFQGYAYLVLGVAKGDASGIRKFDTKVLEDRLRKPFDPGAPPRWDLQWVPGDGPDDHAVCVISVAPPRDGDPIRICHSDFQDERGASVLEDGRIYYREKASTRAARSGEVKALVRRSEKSLPNVDIAVELVGGQVCRYRPDDIEDTFETLFTSHAASYRDRWSASLGAEVIDERLATLRAKAYVEWRNNLDQLAGAAWPGVQFCVTNEAGTYLDDIELTMTFPAGTFGADKISPEDAALTTLLPVLFRREADALTNWLAHSHLAPAVTPNSYPLTWENDDEGLFVTVSGIDLRPDSPWINDNDDLVIRAHDDVESVELEWQLTVKGHDKSYRGTLLLPVHTASIRDDIAATKATAP